MKTRVEILKEIIEERNHQDRKFGPHNNHSPERWLVILMEEVGEVSKAINEINWQEYRDELIDVAAVALAAAECFEENNKDKRK